MLCLAVAALLLATAPDAAPAIIEDDAGDDDFELPSFDAAPATDDSEPGAPDRKPHEKKRSRKKRVPEYRGVGLLSLGAGIGASARGIEFDADLVGSGGVMFRPGIAVVGLAAVQIMPSSTGVTQRYSLGGGVRFGRHTHATLVAAATVLSTPRYGLEFAGTALIQVFAHVKGRFGLTLQPAFTWSAHVLVFSVTLGAGVNF